MTVRDELIAAFEALSPNAAYMATSDAFNTVSQWQPILLVPRNDVQREAFEELQRAGFAFLSTERGHVGFRSSDRGRAAVLAICEREQIANEVCAS